MKKIEAEDSYALPMTKGDKSFESMGDLIWDLQEEIVGVGVLPNAMELVVSYFAQQNNIWFVRSGENHYWQIKPNEIKTNQRVMSFAKKCLKMMQSPMDYEDF